MIPQEIPPNLASAVDAVSPRPPEPPRVETSAALSAASGLTDSEIEWLADASVSTLTEAEAPATTLTEAEAAHLAAGAHALDDYADQWRQPDNPKPGRHRAAIRPDACQECGAALVQVSRANRPRLFCSDGCRRAADHRRGQIRRRVDALREWRTLLRTPGFGGYPRSRVRREIRELAAEVFVLENRRRRCTMNG